MHLRKSASLRRLIGLLKRKCCHFQLAIDQSWFSEFKFLATISFESIRMWKSECWIPFLICRMEATRSKMQPTTGLWEAPSSLYGKEVRELWILFGGLAFSLGHHSSRRSMLSDSMMLLSLKLNNRWTCHINGRAILLVIILYIIIINIISSIGTAISGALCTLTGQHLDNHICALPLFAEAL